MIKYKGYKFSGYNEAYWARLLDNLGAEWEYSREGICPDAFTTRSHPKFVIRNAGVRTHQVDNLYFDFIYSSRWKPITKVRETRIDYFYEHGKRCFYAVWMFPRYAKDCKDIMEVFEKMTEHVNHMFFDFYYQFLWIDGDVYEGYPGIRKDGKFAIIGNQQIYDDMDMEKTFAAYVEASQYEFEEVDES